MEPAVLQKTVTLQGHLDCWNWRDWEVMPSCIWIWTWSKRSCDSVLEHASLCGCLVALWLGLVRSASLCLWGGLFAGQCMCLCTQLWICARIIIIGKCLAVMVGFLCWVVFHRVVIQQRAFYFGLSKTFWKNSWFSWSTVFKFQIFNQLLTFVFICSENSFDTFSIYQHWIKTLQNVWLVLSLCVTLRFRAWG